MYIRTQRALAVGVSDIQTIQICTMLVGFMTILFQQIGVKLLSIKIVLYKYYTIIVEKK